MSTFLHCTISSHGRLTDQAFDPYDFSPSDIGDELYEPKCSKCGKTEFNEGELYATCQRIRTCHQFYILCHNCETQLIQEATNASEQMALTKLAHPTNFESSKTPHQQHQTSQHTEHSQQQQQSQQRKAITQSNDVSPEYVDSEMPAQNKQQQMHSPKKQITKSNRKSGRKRKQNRKALEEDAGFIRANRTEFRKTNALASQYKEQKTCLEDALYCGLIARGLGVSLDQVRAMYSTHKNTPFFVAEAFVKQFGLTLARVTQQFKIAGGEELAILSERTGHYIIQLHITVDKHDKEPDLHCVYYNGRAIADNQKYSKIIYIQDKDRKSTRSARDVFDVVAPELTVRISNVYKLF